MDDKLARQAAEILWSSWRDHKLIDALPEICRPATVEDGYVVQRALAALSGFEPIGWKIAATSTAGQKHIGVDGPLAGRLLDGRRHRSGARLPATHLHMAVVEAEFAFELGKDLPERESEYHVDEVMAAVAALHLAIEVPDSRYNDFTVVGAPQLIADNACTEFFVLGPEAVGWREIDLASFPVFVSINGAEVAAGTGANVLGDPRVALTWLVNDAPRRGAPLRAGEVVTTGTCITPATIKPGDKVLADFGTLGRVECEFLP